MSNRKRRVEFRLSMPSVGSWDGRWSGNGKNYTIVRSMTPAQTEAAGMTDGRGSWTHAWNDGWCARISGRVMEPGERRKKSDGFCDYDWMVNHIIKFGHTRSPAHADTEVEA